MKFKYFCNATIKHLNKYNISTISTILIYFIALFLKVSFNLKNPKIELSS